MKADEVREFLELETYAREHGYIVKDSKAGFHYVYKEGKPFPLADCLSHWDAVRVAYDLAKALPSAERQPQCPARHIRRLLPLLFCDGESPTAQLQTVESPLSVIDGGAGGLSEEIAQSVGGAGRRLVVTLKAAQRLTHGV